MHDGTFTNPGISNSTFVALWLGLDLYDLFNESVLYCEPFERVVLIMLPGNAEGEIWRSVLQHCNTNYGANPESAYTALSMIN